MASDIHIEQHFCAACIAGVKKFQSLLEQRREHTRMR